MDTEPPEAPMIRKRLHEIDNEQISKVPKLDEKPRRLQRDYIDGIWADAKKTLIEVRSELNQIGKDVNEAEKRFYPPAPGGGPPKRDLYGYFRCFITRLDTVDTIALAWYERQAAKLDEIDKQFGKEEKSDREAAYELLMTFQDLKYHADRITLLPHLAPSPDDFIAALYDKVTPLQSKLEKASKKLDKYLDEWQNHYTEKLVWKHFEEAQDSVESKITFAEKYREHVNRQASDKERYRRKGPQRELSVEGGQRSSSVPRNTQSLVSSRRSTPASVGDLPLTRKPSPVPSPPPLMIARARSETRSSSNSRPQSSSNSRQPSSNSRKKSPSPSRKQSRERSKNE